MRITITGASGLIGRRLTKALEQRGDEVTSLSLRKESTAVQAVTVVRDALVREVRERAHELVPVR